MAFSISVVASLPGLETVTVEAKTAAGRWPGDPWRCWVAMKNSSNQMVDHHVPEPSLRPITKNRTPQIVKTDHRR